MLTRIFRDVEYRIVVTPDGDYDFDGRRFQSLSKIAREITGTPWSGPVFFGLKPTAAARKASKGARR